PFRRLLMSGSESDLGASQRNVSMTKRAAASTMSSCFVAGADGSASSAEAAGEEPDPLFIPAEPCAPQRPTHTIGAAAEAFRARCFPAASAAEWSDWRWQLRNRIRNLDGLERVFALSDEERAAVQRLGDRLPVGITPYYASLLD